MSGNDKNAAAFEAFASAGDVQIGEKPQTSSASAGDEGNAGSADAGPASAGSDGQEPQNSSGNAGQGDEGAQAGGDEGQGDEGAQAGEEGPREGEQQESYTKRLKRERAEARREARELRERVSALESTGLLARLEKLENGGLPAKEIPASNVAAVGPKPDFNDQTKYPLGHLDPQYGEDRMDYAARLEAAKAADAALQRQQGQAQQQQQTTEQNRVLGMRDNIAAKGNEIYDDFQEKVVDAGMKQKWPLGQATFEAAYEVENGARILYALASDTKEAERVAALSPYQQGRYVEQKNAEIAEKLKATKIPKAGDPPSRQTNGANSRGRIDPATDNLDDFGKAWQADAEAKRRR